MRKAKEEGLVEERGVPEVTISKSPGTTGHPLPGTACMSLWSEEEPRARGEEDLKPGPALFLTCTRAVTHQKEHQCQFRGLTPLGHPG